MGWLALQHFAAAALADKLSITYLYLSTHGDDRGATLNFHPFKTVVIVIHVLRFRGHGVTVVRVVNNQVGITAFGDDSFARKQAKDFGGASACGVNEAIETQRAALYAVRVQKIDAIFDAGDAVRNVDE